MEESSFAGSIRRFQVEKTNQYAAIALVFYTFVVYVWALAIHPLGPDYAAMADPSSAMSAVAAWVFRAEMAVFGGWASPYHVVNVGLLYGCALFVFLIGREAIDGPAWLSLLAAVFYMASPIHRDAVFILSGVGASLPAVAGLLAVYLGLRAWRARALNAVLPALAIAAVATLVFPSNRWLPIPIFLVGFFPGVVRTNDEERGPALMWLGSAVLVAVAAFWHGVGDTSGNAYHPASMWTPLYMALYPLGFLPETMREFHQREWMAWLTAGIAGLVLLLVVRKAKSSTVLWALLSALAVRVGLGEREVDLVHLLGGRHLLLANAFVLIGVCAMFRAMIRHPKWHRPVVTGTTLWCLVLFGMQIYGAFVWRSVGKEVRAFQESFVDDTGQRTGLLPDFEFYRGAPAFFGESVRHTTPFSRSVDAVSLVVLNVGDVDTFTLSEVSFVDGEAVIEIACDDLGYALGYPYTVDARETDATTIGLVDATETGGRLVIRPKAGVFPEVINRPAP